MQVVTFAKKHVRLLAIIVGAVVVVVGGVVFFSSRPVSIIASVSPKFSGYNGYGRLKYNREAVSDQIKSVLLKKNGVGKADAEAIIAGQIPRKFTADVNAHRKLEEMYSELDSVDVSFDKTTKLSNGDKVKLTVNVADDLPIKAGTKTFKVAGLKKATTYTVKDAVKNLTPKFTGIDGFGHVKANKKFDERFTTSTSEQLSNGDVVKFRLADKYLNSQRDNGRILVGTKTFNHKVSGLTPLSAIADWDKMISLDEDAARDAYQDWAGNLKYDFKTLDTYVAVAKKPHSMFSITSSFDGDVPDSTVYVCFRTVVQVKKTFVSEKNHVNTFYRGFGYSDVPFYEGELHTGNLDRLKDNVAEASTERGVIADFRTDNASAQKLDLQ